MSSLFTIGGLATGMDTNSIISKLMDVERAPEKIMQANQRTYQAQSDAYTKIQTALQGLQTASQAMNTVSGIKGMLSTVGDSSIATVTASSSAAAGSHTLQVTSLAHSQRQVSTGYADGAVFNTGTFTIDDGAGTVTSINLAEGDNTLQGIAAAINGAGANVTASIINDGSSTPNRLVLTGNDVKNYTVDFSGLVTPPGTSGAPVQVPTLLGPTDPSYQAGTPASFVLDGVAITKNSNTVTDVLQGVTLNLVKDGGATTTFNVANDTSSVTNKINAFVSAYNGAINLINAQSAYNSDTKSAGVLSGDSTLRTIQTQLQSLLTSTVSGVTGPYSNLAQLGITSDKSNGTLSVDSTKLSAALSSNFDNVVDLFSHNGSTFATLPRNQYGIAQQFNKAIDSLIAPYIGASANNNGMIATRIHGLQSSITDVNNHISDMETRIAGMQTNLQNQFAYMESVVSRLQTQGSSMLAALGAFTTSSSSK